MSVQFQVLSRVRLGDMVAQYLIDDQRHVEWTIYPATLATQVKIPEQQVNTFSLVQAKLRQDDYDKNFTNGVTMFNNETSRSLVWESQVIEQGAMETRVTTVLRDLHGNLYRHYVAWERSTKRLKTWTSFSNQTQQTQTLDWLASVCLAGLSPFATKQLTGNLNLLRLRSKWAMEGRLERQPVELYGLEPSWKPSGLGIERFGQNGTLPVRQFFPWLGLEDVQNRCLWLIQLLGKASWQLNAARLDDRLVLFGGRPDHDSGAWQVAVSPEATVVTPVAYLTTAQAKLLPAAQRLHLPTPVAPDMSIVYNEWATSWGHPSAKLIQESVAVLAQHDVGTYVIDAGWFQNGDGNFDDTFGDWQVNEQAFPKGLAAVTQLLHAHHLRAGIWFEFENVGRHSKRAMNEAILAKRDGRVVSTIKRRFLDLTLPENQAYLKTHMVNLLKTVHFDYLKVDYNDALGVSMDGPDGQTGASALETQVDATLSIFKNLHQQLPQLQIENCSSGGHRLTPAFMEATELSSFSDAHESQAIPIIAANELMVVPTAKNLIWCVVHPEDSIEKIQYHLIATFLGRICFSGDVRHLSKEQWQTLDAGFAFYRQVSPLIARGVPFRMGAPVLSYHDPHGVQLVGFSDQEDSKQSRQLLVLAWGMNSFTEQTLTVQLPAGQWHVKAQYGDASIEFKQTQTEMVVKLPAGQYRARAVYLNKIG